MSPASGLRGLTRGAATRVRRWTGAARAVAGRSAAQTRRGLRARFGVTGVPEAAWPPSPAALSAGLPTAVCLFPVPPPLGLSRWLWGTTTAGNDGGDRTEVRLGLRVGTGTEAGPGEFYLRDLAPVLAHRPWQNAARSPGLVVVCRAGEATAVHAELRRLGLHREALVLDDPGDSRRTDLWSLTTVIVIPEREGDDGGHLQREAQALGLVVLRHRPDRPLPTDLGDPGQRREAGRAARLELVRQGPPLLPDVTRPTASVHVTAEPRRVVIAGHDLKFAEALADHLRGDGHEVHMDRWAGHARHDPEASRQSAAWADVVLCEWALGNAVWYSCHAPRHLRLVTRVHLQEAATDFPARVRTERLDRAVFVAEHVRRQVIRDHGWPAERSVVVPNAVEVPAEAPSRDPDTRFRLGLVGMVPSRKGLHTALDLLATLRREDPRFTLSLRGRTPDDVPWLLVRPAERDYFQSQLQRIPSDPLLQDAVEFSPHGPDMDRWYATVGVVLSTSEFESFHFTLPDGAVHGAVPRSLAWPGADLLYPESWLEAGVSDLAASIRQATADPRTWREAALAAREEISLRYGQESVLPRLAEEILGVRPDHRSIPSPG
ncbi:glycosyltransferase family 4 protein [Citricoccus zhacaiensis]